MYYNVLIDTESNNWWEYPTQVARYENYEEAAEHAARLQAEGKPAYVAEYRPYA